MKKINRARARKVALALVAATTCYTPAAFAEDDPSNTVRIGMYAIFYHVTSTPIQGPFLPSGVNLNVDLKDTQTLYLAYIRRLNSFLDLELAFGVPPKTTTIGKGPASVGSVPYNGQEIATAKWLAPSALLEYKFLSEARLSGRTSGWVSTTPASMIARSPTPASRSLVDRRGCP